MKTDDAPKLDGRLARRLLGLPDSAPDSTVNQATGELAAERHGIQPPGNPADILDENLFRAMLGTPPGTSTDELNGHLARFLGEEAATDSDPDAATRRQLGIDKGAWDRFGDVA